MMALEQVLAAVGRIDRRDLILWIERRWVRPQHEAGGYVFTDATPSISISIFGLGSATTTQVVRAG